MADKQDSNLTGLRYAEEETLRVLPVSPVWRLLEPNSYSDFGGQLATVARNPINASRQRKKGTVTDLDASGGFNQDLTLNNLTRLLQGFFFSDIREKVSTQPMNAAAVALTSVTASSDTFAAAAGLGSFVVGAVVLASGFGVTANNGVHVVASRSATTLVVGASPGLTDEASPPAAARVVTVGQQFGSGTSAIELNGDLVRFTDTATDLTTLGIIPGEWVFVGGDATATHFAVNAGGYARVSVVAEDYLEFDKTGWTATAETGTGKTIRLFLGSVLRNESDPALIKRRTYHIERTLGNDANGVMSEYLVGAVANELTLTVPSADKVTIDLSFVALDNEQRNGTTGVKTGTRPNQVAEEAFNTSSDFKRIKLALAPDDDAFVDPLFAFATDLTLTVNNNVTPNKAIGVLGGFDTSTGTFEVGGSIEAYFANIEAVQAVRENADVTLDVVMSKPNAALLFDIPLLSLGDGRLNVEQDAPIKIPLENNAAESKFGNTLLFQNFAYLPDVAG